MSERAASISLRVIVDGKVGVASTSSLDDEEIRRTADLARKMAERSEPLEGFRGLYSGNEELPGVEALDPATAQLAASEKASELKKIFEEGRRSETIFAGVYTSAVNSIAVGNSHGVRRWAPVTNVDALFIAMRGNESGYATQCARRHDQLDVFALGSEAIEKATLLSGKNATVEPGEYDVIIEPAALTEAFEWMNMITFSGRAFEDESSFFVGNIGKEFLQKEISIDDDAIDPSFLPFPFDMEGMPKRRVALIERGAPVTPAVDKLMADRLGITPTASAASNESEDHGSALHLSMAGGEHTREELIATTKRGIWITRFNYVNGLLEPKTALMTGMTRDGTFLIEDGKVTARLPNLRWTQSMVDAFRNVDGMTRERRAIGTWWNPVGGTIAPTIRVRNWKITGAQTQ
jgi:predicted Zn-dependent protease